MFSYVVLERREDLTLVRYAVSEKWQDAQRCPLSEKRKEWERDGTELGHVTHRLALAAGGFLRQDKREEN